MTISPQVMSLLVVAVLALAICQTLVVAAEPRRRLVRVAARRGRK